MKKLIAGIILNFLGHQVLGQLTFQISHCQCFLTGIKKDTGTSNHAGTESVKINTIKYNRSIRLTCECPENKIQSFSLTFILGGKSIMCTTDQRNFRARLLEIVKEMPDDRRILITDVHVLMPNGKKGTIDGETLVIK